jgi:hypothetical protein
MVPILLEKNLFPSFYKKKLTNFGKPYMFAAFAVVVMFSKDGCGLEKFFVTEKEPRPLLDIIARHRSHGRKMCSSCSGKIRSFCRLTQISIFTDFPIYL